MRTLIPSVRGNHLSNPDAHSLHVDGATIAMVVLAATEHGEIKLLTSGLYRDTVRKNEGQWQIVDRKLDLELGF